MIKYYLMLIFDHQYRNGSFKFPYLFDKFATKQMFNSITFIHYNNYTTMGAFLSEPFANKQTTSGSFNEIQYATSCMQGWRRSMEDAHIAIIPFTSNNFGLFGVFDGHGGSEIAIFVQRNFADELEKNQYFKQGKYQKALKSTFLKMDELLESEKGRAQIQKIYIEMNDGMVLNPPSYAGCTANVILVTPEYIYCANSGDSRAVVSRQKTAIQLSFDHKPDNQDERNRIGRAGGEVTYGRVNGNLNLSRSIGDFQYKKNKNFSFDEQLIIAVPDVHKIQNKNVDFIIMGCDGIWETKTHSDMVQWIQNQLKQSTDQPKILQVLLDELLAKDTSHEVGLDNMTAILICFQQRK